MIKFLIFYFILLTADCFSISVILQIDAHVGNVSDLAFSQPNKQLYVITCGEDKTIKVCFVQKFSVY